MTMSKPTSSDSEPFDLPAWPWHIRRMPPASCSPNEIRLVVMQGDGIGPEITAATLAVLQLEQIPVTFEHSPHAESSSCILVR
jgi:hypothetical protein